MVRTPRNIPAPEALKSKAAKWTARYQRILAGNVRGDWATKGARRLLCAALRELAYGKCVFCESPLEVSGYLEVEHYHPKAVHQHLTFDWDNLLPSCRLCNNAKGEQDHGGVLLKPDAEDPEPFFRIHPDTGHLEPHPNLDAAGKHRALETIRICDLQRPALCTRRAEMLSRVGRWLRQLLDDGSLSDPLREEWECLSHPAIEYKLVIRHALDRRGQTQLSAHDRTRFATRS
ncbi:MAG: retron system putative HNH endonuclease [Bryobacteraceae bacterium]